MSVFLDYAEIVDKVKKIITEETASGWMKTPTDTFTVIEMALDEMYQRGRKDERWAQEEAREAAEPP